ncbi:MAG: UDP-3-O-(3-hydroxymyristoyl)glucosamine N-acyltransferase [Candidatus Marinimicrobia bacterium]|nr:UDP-3-O-(3-hydroxymyristoyl)glucosamine N-acyltransferase [Candidatus Neomarinimicrobiota bacterium]
MKFTLAQITELIKGKLEGDENIVITDVAEIQNAIDGQISFLHNPKYYKYIGVTKASAVIVPNNFKGSYKNLIYVDNPNYAFSLLIKKFRPEPSLPEPDVDKTAIISNKASVSNKAYIGPYVVIEEDAIIEDGVVAYGHSYIGKGVSIGANTVIYPNVTIYRNCHIGRNVMIHSGTVIGSDGFGFTQVGGRVEKIPQAGGVIIEDDVEIGANCTIDRATIGNTVVGMGTKLDNLIQIGHNVKIGKFCLFAAQTGIAGSTTIEDGVLCGGQVGISGHLHIGKGAKIAAQSGVSKDIPPGATVFGYPARNAMKVNRELAYISSLPNLFKKVKEIEEKLKKGTENEK